MNEKKVYAKLLAGRRELGGYVKYVFQDLNTGKYILCTKFPNWNSEPIKLGTIGYLKYEKISAGELYSIRNDCVPYKYTIDKFISFEKEEKRNSIIIT